MSAFLSGFTGGSGAGARRDREGKRIAQLFRQVRVSGDIRACDLDGILQEDNLEVAEAHAQSCGYTACLVRVPGGGGIMISAGQDVGRRRFSLAHELGHYHIPSHKDVGALLSCADADMRARQADSRHREWEANDFAAELLMPYRLFSRDVDRREVSFRTVAELTVPEMYNVSFTAASWRLVQTTRDPCALVVSAGGRVEWIARSDAWSYPIAERQQLLPEGSVAAAVARGETATARPERVAPEAWLCDPAGRREAPSGIELLESTHAIPRVNQVLSLLWVVDSDES
jgi:hypothetical protein